MSKPIWISLQLTLAIHRRQLAEHGGIDGVRDEGLLSSALARSKHLLTYSKEQPELARLAAAYGFGITRNHPFLDGNKRTAAVVCETFIDLNRYQLMADDKSMYLAFLQLAEGTLSEEDLADWIHSHLQPT